MKMIQIMKSEFYYRIAYLIKDMETIDILGVFHGALAIEKYL